MSGQTDPDSRAMFLTAIEYGVSPIARADYSKRDDEPHVPRAPRRREPRRERAATPAPQPAPVRVTRPSLLVVSAADILAEVMQS